VNLRRILASVAYWVGIAAGGYLISLAIGYTFGLAPDSTIGGTVTALVGFALIAALWWRISGHKGDIDAHHNWILGLVEANGELRTELGLLKDHLGVDVHVRDVDPNWAHLPNESTVEEDETGPVTQPAMPVVRPVPQRRDEEATVEMARAWDVAAGQLDTRVSNVSTAHDLALLEDRIVEWRRKQQERTEALSHVAGS